MSSYMCKPLFVVGKHRSGTTWLGNLLLDHPEIAGVHHLDHRGIHESAFFSHVTGRYGDLNIFSSFVEFASVMSRSDYFRLAGVSFDDLMELYPASYADVFRTVMDRLATRYNAEYWIEKSPMHTFYMREIGETYTDAKFVGIMRNPVDTAFSWLKRQELEGAPQRLIGLARITIDKYVVDSHMLRMKASWPERVHIIEYEELRESKSDVLTGICDFLDISSVEMESEYEPNTSYTEGQRDHHRPTYEEIFVKIMYFYILRAAPIVLLRAIKKIFRNSMRKNLPNWFFKSIR